MQDQSIDSSAAMKLLDSHEWDEGQVQQKNQMLDKIALQSKLKALQREPTDASFDKLSLVSGEQNLNEQSYHSYEDFGLARQNRSEIKLSGRDPSLEVP